MGVEKEFINYLLDNTICSQQDIDQAIVIQDKYQSKITSILLNSGIVSEEKILKSLSDFFDIPLAQTIDIEKIEFEKLSFSFFDSNNIFPIKEVDNKLLVAINIHFQFSSILKFSSLLKKEVIPYLADEDFINKIKLLYKEEDTENQLTIDNDEEIEKLKELASEAPVIKIINNHFNKAVNKKASDIHYESFKDGMYVRIRIDGTLHTVDTITQTYKKSVIARLKLISKMNISEHRLPQDGRISIKVSNQDIDIRASSVPTAFGESFVLRLLGKQAISYSLDALDFYQDHLMLLREITSKPNGIFLTTGPTGSGKTTTLYSLLNEINSDDIKIITVEDPVEYELSGISQIQVKSQIGFHFANALRSILRQDPDIIMVGEIRDEETARISIQSALTGHTVLSTLHTNSALGAITRLLDMNIEYFLLKSSINGLMAQRLVKKLCPHCKEEITLSSEIQQSLDVVSLLKKFPFVQNKTYKAIGCKECNNSGYLGRLPVAEILLFNDDVKEAMEKDQNFNDLNALNIRTLFQDAILKLLDGKTSYEEILKLQ